MLSVQDFAPAPHFGATKVKARPDGMFRRNVGGVSCETHACPSRLIPEDVALFLERHVSGPKSGASQTTAQEEIAMKLTSSQVQRTLDQFQAQAIPESHPVMTELTNMFGDHTFFLDGQGLNIVKPVTADGAAREAARIVNLANWADSTWTKLAPHEPEPTDIAIELAA
jgi:hypothetical protein